MLILFNSKVRDWNAEDTKGILRYHGARETDNANAKKRTKTPKISYQYPKKIHKDRATRTLPKTGVHPKCSSELTLTTFVLHVIFKLNICTTVFQQYAYVEFSCLFLVIHVHWLLFTFDIRFISRWHDSITCY